MGCAGTWPVPVCGRRPSGHTAWRRRNDLDLKSLAASCDVFYIGGTKVGALFGEAVVILNDELKADFRYHIKQQGGMLAKGPPSGAYSLESFAGRPVFGAGTPMGTGWQTKIRCACVKKGYPFLVENTTNQVFPIMPDSLLESWKDKYSYTNPGKGG